ncbi:hypothetical protein GCM10010381_68870 [Streptomyces xantholiticus]|nr:hypothetical protein GCM10010381_68870 [Streptomyces xantholiticus]
MEGRVAWEQHPDEPSGGQGGPLRVGADQLGRPDLGLHPQPCPDRAEELIRSQQNLQRAENPRLQYPDQLGHQLDMVIRGRHLTEDSKYLPPSVK